MTDFNKLRRNVKLRHFAKELRELIDEELTAAGITKDAEVKRVWRNLLDGIFKIEQATQKVGLTPMSYEEARRWARTTECPFRPHKGKKVIDVPRGFFEWLDAQPDFRRELFRYMQSEYYTSSGHGSSDD